MSSHQIATLLALLLVPLAEARAQGPEMPPPVVRTSSAREQTVRESVRLTGSVEAPRSAVVATEVAGIVAEVLAREGETVRRGAPLVKLRSASLEFRLAAARGQLAEAEARKKSAELRLGRLRELASSDVVPEQQVDDGLYEAEAWEGRCEQWRAEVSRLARDLELATVAAPFAGVVGRERTEVGEWVAVGDPVADLIDRDRLEVRVEVPERYFSSLEVGARVPVRLEALPGVTLEGTVRAVVPRADPAARTFPALVRLPGGEHRLGAGMLAEVELPTGAERRAVVVPKDAVVTEGGSRFVFVVDGDSKAKKVQVRTGATAGLWIAIQGDGIAAGTAVVVRGNERLAPGVTVRAESLETDP